MTSPAARPARPHVAAGVLFLDDDARVLLVVPSYKEYLDLPGGYVEPGETPKAAAAREVREELSISPRLGRLLVADWWQTNVDSTGGAKLLFVFDGGRLSSGDQALIAVDGREVIDYGFHATDALSALTVPRLVNRIEHAVAAHLGGGTTYLENGQPVSARVPEA